MLIPPVAGGVIKLVPNSFWPQRSLCLVFLISWVLLKIQGTRWYLGWVEFVIMNVLRKVVQKAVIGDTSKSSPNVRLTKSVKNRPNRYIKLMQCR